MMQMFCYHSASVSSSGLSVLVQTLFYSRWRSQWGLLLNQRSTVAQDHVFYNTKMRRESLHSRVSQVCRRLCNASVLLSRRISSSRPWVWRSLIKKSTLIRRSLICRRPAASVWRAERETHFIHAITPRTITILAQRRGVRYISSVIIS